MRLYHHPMSSNARRALMTAIHLGLSLELAEVDLMNADDRRRLGDIEAPTLVLNAANDPFVPARALPDVQSLPPAVHFDCPDEGGHVGFLAGAWPGSQDWLAERVLAHFDHVR